MFMQKIRHATYKHRTVLIVVVVLLAIGLPHEVAHGSLRLSLSEYNTPEEIDYILEVLPGIVSYLRGMSPVWDELETGLRPHLI